MRIKLIRNATVFIEYAGKRFLIDPVLGGKGSFRAFGDSLRKDMKNPIVDLPIPMEEIINVDAVVITHMHLDHFDPAANELLPRDKKVFVENEEALKELENSGFQDIEILSLDSKFHDIKLNRTPGQHGRGEVLEVIGNVCGVVFSHPDEKSLYIAGDTVWYKGVEDTINHYQPEIIVLNGGGNILMDEMLVMGKDDILNVHRAKPDSKIVSVHMEAMNHWTLSRKDLRSFAEENGFSGFLFVPEDGEEIYFELTIDD